MKRQRRHRSGRDGFAIMAALLVSILVGAAALALAQLVRADATRTFSELTDAQLRQLLIVGEQQARSTLSTPRDQVLIDLRLPDELQAWSASANVTGKITGESAEFLVVAQMGDRAAQQTLQYQQQSGSWRLVSAKLSPSVTANPARK